MFATNLKVTELASQTYVQTQITNNLPTGTVQEISVGNGLSIEGGLGTITTTGTLKLEADLSELEDVSTNIPVADQVLTWDSGTSSWMPKTFLGSGTSSLVWDDIGNAQSLSGRANNILKVNSSSDEIQFVENNLIYGPDIISGIGITHTTTAGDNGMILRLDTNLSEIYTTNSSTTETTIVVVDEDGNQRRIKSGNLGLDTLYNPTSNPFLRSSGVSAIEPVAYDPASTTFSLTDERYRIDFDVAESLGISGVLSIESGGTSASNVIDARENLGLTYNEDIMTYTDPQFVGNMYGTDILIRPYCFSASGISVTVPGDGYTSGTASLVTEGEYVTVSLTTGASGEVLTVTPDSNCGHQDFLNWNTSPQTGYILQGSEVDAMVSYEPRSGYINFGQVTGSSGYGIAYDGNFWFREQGGDWLNNIPFTIQDATNVEDTVDPDEGSILIYDGTTFNFHTVKGDMTMTNFGTMSITTGAINPTAILASHDGSNVEVDRFEFGTLYNINTGTTIQEQLDNGVSVNPANEGDIIYRSSSSWEALEYPASSNKVLCATGISIPSWDFVSETFIADDNYASGDGIVYKDNGGVSGALYTDMSTILTQHSGATGGIELVNGILSTDLSQLPTANSFNIDDYSMVVNNLSDGSALDEQIGVSVFISNFAGDGICYSGGQLTLDTGTDIIPDVNDTYDLGSSSFCWAETHTSRLFLCPYATTGAAGSGSNAGEVIYVTDGGGGDAALGVWDGSVWRKVVLSSF